MEPTTVRARPGQWPFIGEVGLRSSLPHCTGGGGVSVCNGDLAVHHHTAWEQEAVCNCTRGSVCNCTGGSVCDRTGAVCICTKAVCHCAGRLLAALGPCCCTWVVFSCKSPFVHNLKFERVREGLGEA